MNEYCCNFECVSKDHCVDDCSEIQCEFQYDCENCRHECGCNESEVEGE